MEDDDYLFGGNTEEPPTYQLYTGTSRVIDSNSYGNAVADSSREPAAGSYAKGYNEADTKYDDDLLFGNAGFDENLDDDGGFRLPVIKPEIVEKPREELAAADTTNDSGEATGKKSRVAAEAGPQPRFEAEIGIPMEGSASIPHDMEIVRKHRLFASLFWNDFYKLITRQAERYSIPVGTVVQQQGSSELGCSHFFIVTKGTLQLIRDGVLIDTLGVGDGFNEDMLRYQQPANATIACETAVEAVALDRETYLALAATQRQARSLRRLHRAA